MNLIPKEYFVIACVIFGTMGTIMVVDRKVSWVNKIKIAGIIAAIIYIALSTY